MKVLLINGSPRKNGNTHEALVVIEEELQKKGIETDWQSACPGLYLL